MSYLPLELLARVNDQVASAGVFRSVFREVILNAINLKTAVADREQELAGLLGIGSDCLVLRRDWKRHTDPAPNLAALPTIACSAPFTYCTAPSPEALCFVGERMPTFSGGRLLPGGADKVFSNDFACSTPAEEILLRRAAATGRDPGREKCRACARPRRRYSDWKVRERPGLECSRYACRSALLAAAGSRWARSDQLFGPFPGPPIGTRTIFSWIDILPGQVRSLRGRAQIKIQLRLLAVHVPGDLHVSAAVVVNERLSHHAVVTGAADGNRGGRSLAA